MVNIMKTLPKPKAKKAARPTVARGMGSGVVGISPVIRRLPPAKGTVADLLKMKDFGAGANLAVIESAHAARDL